ncbi:WD repeat-containing protein wat1 [Trypanosoma grayi]|uniref:WD repeat-containing protein wat1 n=1 Tax=Trypanosoma grayi TaxID=71804 RepID=UPI0004F44169|nr:WD repeat-containing protein wat1 [Trypanosoma grayi]KEG08641.1 WD repeat-containing protein wat1 [Trypanosoma grayi]
MCAAFLISASYDQQIRFWDGSSGRTVRCFAFQDSQVNALLMIPDTTYLAVAGFGVVRVYDIGVAHTASGGGGIGSQAPPLFSSYENQSAMNVTSLGTFPLHTRKGIISFFGTSAEGSNSSFFNTFDLAATQRPLSDVFAGELSTALYATSEDGHIRFFNATSPTTLNLICDIATGAAITCSALSPNRQYLLTGSQIGRVSVWHLPAVIAVATQQLDSSVHTAFGQRPMQEITFEADYTAIRSIALEPLARWAVVATNAGKLHFLRFLVESGAPGHSTDTDVGVVKVSAIGEGNEEEPQKGEGIVSDSIEAEACSTPTTTTNLLSSNSNCPPPESVYRSAVVSNELGNSGLRGNVLGSSFAGHDKESIAAALIGSLDPNSLRVKAFSSNKGGDSPHNASTESSTHKSAFRQQVVMEVFHSFQAHYKYILKVAISPNADMLVTCSADYTVGRFLIPLELQKGAAEKLNQPGDAFCSSPAIDPPLSATAPMAAQGSEVVQSEALADAGAAETPVAAAILSPLQPIEGEGDKNPLCAENAEGGEKKPLDTEQTGGTKKTATFAADSSFIQSTRKAADRSGVRPSDFQDASSVLFSVVPSTSAEGNTASQQTGGLQFKALKPLTGHARWVWDCVFSDCGQFLFTSSSDHNLRMWTGLLTDRVQFTCFIGHTKPVVCCILYYEKK